MKALRLSIYCAALIVTLTSLSFTTAGESMPTVKPNIILVMADDQGWGDTAYNGHQVVRTPAIDEMAKSGFVFDRFYAGAPVCSPTRASVMTGRNPVRTKVPNHGHYMRPQEQTIAETLKSAGYVTGIFGKVHLGSGQPDTPCNPSGMGFDEWVVGLNFFDNDPYLSRNGVVEHFTGKGTVIAMDEGLKFIKKHKDGTKPLFTVIWFPAPHDPHLEVPDGDSLYDGDKNAGYFREITLLDQQIGRLRKELRDMQLADNTILWYCSDNGGLLKESSGGRDKKGSIYEGGLRIPCVVEWPSKKLLGRSPFPASTCDMYPTLLAMAGITFSHPHPLDGIDISGVFSGSMTTRTKPMGFWHLFTGGQSTYSDKILKAIMEKQHAHEPTPHDPYRMRKDVDEFPQYPDDYSVGHVGWNDWPWKLHRIGQKDKTVTYELYNLVEDPNEANDLAKDPAQKERLEQMKKDLQAWATSVIHSINGLDYKK